MCEGPGKGANEDIGLKVQSREMITGSWRCQRRDRGGVRRQGSLQSHEPSPPEAERKLSDG